MSTHDRQSHDEKQLPTRTTGKQWTKLKPRARKMRKEPTYAESVLWEKLRRKQIGGFKFRRQQPIGNFIVDFYCSDAHLVIEVDGSIHDEDEQAKYDENRQLFLEELGIQVIRFTNDAVIKETDAVIDHIMKMLNNGDK